MAQGPDRVKGVQMGTPKREPQGRNTGFRVQDLGFRGRNIIEYEDTGRHIPIMFLLHSWGSLFGVPS